MKRTAEERAAFIRDNTRLLAPPLAPGMRLRLADEAVELWQKTEEELGEMGLPPPFWAFAWAGGQALARYIEDNPQLVAGRRVLDFASGSGLVAIAAAMAGAAEIEASEIDEFAQVAIAMNAAENGAAVTVLAEDVVGADRGWDVILAGDVSYQKDMAEAVTAWLERLAARGALVLIGDPRRTYLALDRLECVSEYSVPVTRALEDSEIKRTGVFRFGRAKPVNFGETSQ
ncbi:MAG: methyltransferase [Hyphomicrobiales bacterium]|nr:methyltransferase [Hyphomicrobiales bacterium]